MSLCVIAVAANGQDVVAPRSQGDLVPPALQQALAAQNQSATGAAPSENPTKPLAQWGPTSIWGTLSYRFLYGDGIPAESGQNLTTAINSVSPDVLLDLGTHWSLDYSPTWVFYSNRAFADTVDESVRLAGWGEYEEWTLKLSASYGAASSPSIETGRQTKQTSSAIDFDATYGINSRLGLELTAGEVSQSAEEFTNSRGWSTTDWLHYLIEPGLDASVGLGLGYVEVSEGLNTAYYRPQAQVSWTATQKITLTARGGVENRRSQGGGSGAQTNAIYGASVDYHPFEHTALSLAVDRRVAASYFEDQLTRTTGWNAELQQRLLGRLQLSAGVSHERIAYISSLNGAATPRNDDLYSINLRLSTVLFDRCTVAAVFQNTRDSSAVAGFGLSSRQAGFEIGYRF